MKRTSIFVLTFVNECDVYLFNNGADAYNYIVERLKSDFISPEGKEEAMQELNEDYNEYPDSFAIEGYCWARLEEIMDGRD